MNEETEGRNCLTCPHLKFAAEIIEWAVENAHQFVSVDCKELEDGKVEHGFSFDKNRFSQAIKQKINPFPFCI